MINFLIGFFICATIGCALFVYVRITNSGSAKALRIERGKISSLKLHRRQVTQSDLPPAINLLFRMGV